MKTTRKFLIASLMGLVGCSTILPSGSSQRLSLTELRSLQIESTTESVIFKMFGEPLMQLSSQKEKSTSWIYFSPSDPKEERVSFVFDTNKQVLKEINWFVLENEKEGNPIKAMERYPNSHFKRHEVQWQIVDRISSRTTFVDNKNGIAIDTNDDRPEEVTLISFSPPGSIVERDGFLGLLKGYPRDDWQVVADRRLLDRAPSRIK